MPEETHLLPIRTCRIGPAEARHKQSLPRHLESGHGSGLAGPDPSTPVVRRGRPRSHRGRTRKQPCESRSKSPGPSVDVAQAPTPTDHQPHPRAAFVDPWRPVHSRQMQRTWPPCRPPPCSRPLGQIRRRGPQPTPCRPGHSCRPRRRRGSRVPPPAECRGELGLHRLPIVRPPAGRPSATPQCRIPPLSPIVFNQLMLSQDYGNTA